jgi:hypothetical protein
LDWCNKKCRDLKEKYPDKFTDEEEVDIEAEESCLQTSLDITSQANLQQ